MTPIRPAQMWEFCEDFAKGAYRHLRFGQAFVNVFADDLGIENDHELFYCESRIVAEKLIDSRGYINWNA